MVKSAFLEHHRDIFLSIFKGIVQDPYQLIHKILDVCWAGIWSDPKIKRTLKISLFNESTIFQVTGFNLGLRVRLIYTCLLCLIFS